MSVDDARRVKITHPATGLFVEENKFPIYRNIEICYIKLEALVNKWIKDMRQKFEEAQSKKR
jgi:hypothetical protein